MYHKNIIFYHPKSHKSHNNHSTSLLRYQNLRGRFERSYFFVSEKHKDAQKKAP